jgi:hypothetical protein
MKVILECKQILLTRRVQTERQCVFKERGRDVICFHVTWTRCHGMTGVRKLGERKTWKGKCYLKTVSPLIKVQLYIGVLMPVQLWTSSPALLVVIHAEPSSMSYTVLEGPRLIFPTQKNCIFILRILMMKTKNSCTQHVTRPTRLHSEHIIVQQFTSQRFNHQTCSFVLTNLPDHMNQEKQKQRFAEHINEQLLLTSCSHM